MAHTDWLVKRRALFDDDITLLFIGLHVHMSSGVKEYGYSGWMYYSLPARRNNNQHLILLLLQNPIHASRTYPKLFMKKSLIH